ncbi:hypothetical protein Q7O_004430 [Pectobacterium carotovorum subsp. carotovorum PCCS1]|nr:hypothetical protein [Pectobacterium carotovorum subsp. carotovorum PCCS1]
MKKSGVFMHQTGTAQARKSLNGGVSQLRGLTAHPLALS